MVGLKMFSYVSRCLKEIMAAPKYLIIRRLNGTLIGDFWQLPPIFAKPLFCSNCLINIYDVAGWIVYLTFNKFLQLDTIIRQAGSD